MTKDNKKQKENFSNIIQNASESSETVTFSCKVDKATVDDFKAQIERFNSKNDKKLKIGKVVQMLLNDFQRDLKLLNSEEEQSELDI